jgi:hypothetical protein
MSSVTTAATPLTKKVNLRTPEVMEAVAAEEGAEAVAVRNHALW